MNNSVLNICCITTDMKCTIIQLSTYNHIYQHVDIYTAQTVHSPELNMTTAFFINVFSIKDFS